MPYSHRRSGHREAVHDVYVFHVHVSACVHAHFARVDEMNRLSSRGCTHLLLLYRGNVRPQVKAGARSCGRIFLSPFLSDWKSAKAQLKLLFLDYRKIISRFFFPLIFDISLYRFFIYFPYRSTKIASCPHMLSPILFPQRWEFLLQYSRYSSLQILHYLTWRHRCRTRQKHVYMVYSYTPL